MKGKSISEGGAASRGWTTEAETTIVNRALDGIRGEISSTVKVVDPYLDVSDMIGFVDSLNPDIDAWFITSELRNASQLESELSKYNSQGRTVEILRIMDERSSIGDC